VHADDVRPLDPQLAAPPARDYSRAYLHHLVRSGELLAAMLLTWNNVAFYQALMAGIRASIAEGRFQQFKEETLVRLGSRQ
jgi:queuine tRNA-ribosyltransferase